MRKKTLTVPGRKIFHEGDIITVDGTSGEVLAGAAEMVEPALGGAFATLMDWADAARDIGVRANADTPEDAAMAQRFGVDGIGLCRTEHMFFDAARLTVMREMIFAENPADRAAALELLLPMQRDDFTELFKMMQGQPVCIRLFDPPLHEFLPGDREGIRDAGRGAGPAAGARVGADREPAGIQPHAGHARRAAGDHRARNLRDAGPRDLRGDDPRVEEGRGGGAGDHDPARLRPARGGTGQGARRRHRGRGAQRDGQGFHLSPRRHGGNAARRLRAGEIAEHSAFLSFGTNDLTQMTYGLSRDDAGGFMSAYVQQGVFEEDPFQELDLDGVGELLLLGAARGRAARPDVMLSMCGEHAGHPDSIGFCRRAGFDYVSCSPFRVPVAKLAAAQLSISDRDLDGDIHPDLDVSG
jgi:pyruvate,orthophosphate dikinase